MRSVVGNLRKVSVQKDVFCSKKGVKCLGVIKRGKKVLVEMVRGEREREREFQFYCRNCGIERLNEVRDKLFDVEREVYGGAGA